MHYLADFDSQTKLLHVGYSVLGMLVSMLVLVKLKPTILPRMVTAVVLGFVLVFCLSTPLAGDQERLKNIYSIGWFSLGLLFGIGRGEFVIEYLTRKFFGAPDQLAEQETKAEASGEADLVCDAPAVGGAAGGGENTGVNQTSGVEKAPLVDKAPEVSKASADDEAKGGDGRKIVLQTEREPNQTQDKP